MYFQMPLVSQPFSARWAIMYLYYTRLISLFDIRRLFFCFFWLVIDTAAITLFQSSSYFHISFAPFCFAIVSRFSSIFLGYIFLQILWFHITLPFRRMPLRHYLHAFALREYISMLIRFSADALLRRWCRLHIPPVSPFRYFHCHFTAYHVKSRLLNNNVSDISFSVCWFFCHTNITVPHFNRQSRHLLQTLLSSLLLHIFDTLLFHCTLFLRFISFHKYINATIISHLFLFEPHWCAISRCFLFQFLCLLVTISSSLLLLSDCYLFSIFCFHYFLPLSISFFTFYIDYLHYLHFLAKRVAWIDSIGSLHFHASFSYFLLFLLPSAFCRICTYQLIFPRFFSFSSLCWELNIFSEFIEYWILQIDDYFQPPAVH